jgi:hypothetical protein
VYATGAAEFVRSVQRRLPVVHEFYHFVGCGHGFANIKFY